MLNTLGPAQIRDVHQAINAVFDLNEGAKVGQVTYSTLDNLPGRVTIGEILPGIFLELLHTERDAAVRRIDRDHDSLNFVARLDQLGRMLHPLGPGHLGDMNKAFNALFEFDKRAVIGHRKNAALNARTYWVPLDGIKPRVRRELFKAQGDALLILIELENLDLDLIADIDQIARVGETSPAHIGNVQQAIDAAKINKCTVVGEVFDRAGKNDAFFKVLERGRTLGVLLFLEDLLCG